MEDKQLNFNQPLLSVRRFSPTVASEKEEKHKTENTLHRIPRLPHYRSELKSGPVSNPVAVPFVWEQKPGRPKEDIKPQTQYSDRPPVAPKLPPGRSPKANQQNSDKDSATASVTKSQLQNVTHDVQSVPSVLDKNKNIDILQETKEDEESSDSSVGEEPYVDALDTLSRTESFFLNCSLSGLSGFDDLEMKPSGRFSTDPQMQEFMMGRFLPAAKAMASEMPEYVPKKKPVVREKPRQIKKKAIGDKPLLRYGPSFANQYSHKYHNNDGDDNEESDDDYHQGDNLPAVCGLLPRFCYKSSLCLLNPVPAMSVRTRVPRSPASRMQARSSSACSFSRTENEQSNSLTSERKSADEVQTDAIEDKTSLRNQLNSNHRQRLNLKGSSLRGPLDGHNTSIYFVESPQSIRDEKGFFAIPEETKGCKTFQEVSSDQGSSKELDSGNPVEKTLYVDTIQQVESPRTRFCLSHKQGMERMPGSGDKDYDIAKSKDQHKLDNADKGAKLLPEAQKSNDFIVVSSVNKSNQKEGMEAINAFGHDQEVYRNSNTAKNLNVNEKEATESLQKRSAEAENLENSHQSHLQFPVPPPLPKSPSDSWLFRTLPSICTKNSFQRSYIGTITNSQNWGLKAQSGDPKSEQWLKLKRNS
ncbi:uncharacterized protein LOC111395512 isoform X1 [Olea europaea var. sylvestris]|uniref:Uncharacterized protein n=1 Tax=Olea europaea subsp. europaea TaxID=158383 RepID=A0A8S0QZS9_OLEEU|nr:uncharacterized protein LOC111395512 isoform X1 [Olea europaea var. sylvestris]CAA2971648.1 Hypothetical predicted protein [Olea europaea subsp. europaea]